MRARIGNHLKIAAASVLAIAATSTVWARPDASMTSTAAPTSAPAVGGPGATTRPNGWRGGPGGGGPGGGGPGGGGGDDHGGGFGRRGPGDNWREQAPPTADEWEDIETFMRDNSPVRLALYQRIESEMGLDRIVTQAVRRRIAARYRDLMTMKDRNNDLYEFAFKQMRIEDDALGTLLRIKKEGETPALSEQLKTQMRSFVDNSLSERKARLTRLREFMSREEQNLARDTADHEALEQKQRERFERDMKRMLDFSTDADAPATKPSDGK
jgi:hypothetical protein